MAEGAGLLSLPFLVRLCQVRRVQMLGVGSRGTGGQVLCVVDFIDFFFFFLLLTLWEELWLTIKPEGS